MRIQIYEIISDVTQ